jgi:hypothetical protein
LKVARTIYEEAIQRYGAENILLYTSETGDDINKMILVMSIKLGIIN